MSNEFQTNSRAFEGVSERIAQLSPAKRALFELKLKKSMREKPEKETILKKKEREAVPLSFAQQRLWYLDQYEPNSPYYNIPRAWRLKGTLNIDAIRQALNAIIERHESLRTSFPKIDGEPVQIIAQKLAVDLPLTDLSDYESEERETAVKRLCIEEARRPFDLSQGPLIRCSLLRLDAQEHVLRLTMHHIISDGWSMGVLDRELWALYKAFSHGRPSPLPALPIQYADFSEWQRQWFQGEVLKKQLGYWKAQLSGAPLVLELPTDRPYPVVQRFQGALHTEMLPAHLLGDLKTLSLEETGVTLFMILLAAFQLLLHRYTGQEDIVVGSPIAGRNRTEIVNLIGFFVNTLVLRTDFSGNPTFKELLRRVREVALGAFEHQDLPFEKLVEELKPERLPNRNPLVQVVFALQNRLQTSYRLSELTIRKERVDSNSTKFDITFFATETAEGLKLSWEYNTDLFDRTTIERMMEQFKTLLEGIVVDPNQRIGELPLLTEDDQHQLLVSWNLTHTAYPRHKCIHQLFEEEAAKAPDNVAVVIEGRQLTYGELNAKANQLAHYLQRVGVGPEVMVGLCLDRSMEVIIGMLAILKAGGAYVPLDPSYPKDRLSFMLEDIQINVLLTQEKLLSNLPEYEGHILCLDSSGEILAKESKKNPSQPVAADNLAYVMYTSGSTGRPKGVEVLHREVTRLVFGNDYVSFGHEEVFLQMAPISFDASTFEIWGALLHGGTCVIYPERVPSTAMLAEVISRHGVTTLWLTSSLFNAVIDEAADILVGVRQLLTGGEALSVAHVKRALELLPNTRLVNGYGPTESTTFTCCYNIPRLLKPNLSSVPIGRPIGNTRVHILNAGMKPVPVGVAGELYIGGEGLARGYRNRPELTAESFVSDPFNLEPKARLYRTGDLARYLPDGDIEFLGRIDEQIKIRGFRIEPAEVEVQLSQHPAVSKAAVVAREDLRGDLGLVAYVVTSSADPSSAALRDYLAERLPDYMVPGAFMFLDALPLTHNGKLDHKALPTPIQALSTCEPYAAPRSSIEEWMVQTWKELLSVEQVGIHDDFFLLGGHSLLAVKLMERIRQQYQQNLPLAILFKAATIAGLSEIVHERHRLTSWSPLVTIQPEGSKPPMFFVHPAGGNVLGLADLSRCLGKDYPVYGLQAYGVIEGQEPHTCLKTMASSYIEAMRKVQPQGPYFLGGISFGGIVAYEMAVQLRSSEDQVAIVIIGDTWLLRGPHFKPWRFLISRFTYPFTLSLRAILTLLARKFAGRRYVYVPKRRGPFANELHKRMNEAHKLAVQNYFPELYPGKVVLFRSSDLSRRLCRMEHYFGSAEMGWNELACGGVELYRLPGVHHNMFYGEHASVFAARVKECMDRALREHGVST